MKKKIICLLTATTLLVSNVCSVSAANVCGGSTVFQNNKTRALATTYCSYATVSDYKVVTVDTCYRFRIIYHITSAN